MRTRNFECRGRGIRGHLFLAEERSLQNHSPDSGEGICSCYDAEVDALLEVRNLTVEFPARATSGGRTIAVRDVSFEIAPGQVLGLVGESGSGKSATSLALIRLLPLQAQVRGEVFFRGANLPKCDLLQLSENGMRHVRGTKIAMIFQEPMTALNPVMRVGDQIAEAVAAHNKVTKKEAWDRAVEAMDEVAITDAARRARDYPHQLSGGMRQRVMIAMAIVNRPQLLIADEPTTALDVTIQAQILELLALLRNKFGLAMLFISHDLAVVSQVADEVAVMYAGSLVEMGPKQDIFRAPAHPYTRGLLDSVPSLSTDRGAALPTIEASYLSETSQDSPLVEITSRHWVRKVGTNIASAYRL